MMAETFGAGVQKGVLFVALAAFFTMLGMIIKSLLPYRMSVIEAQGKRIAKLEAKVDVLLEELRVSRHELANSEQAMELFLTRIETDPENAKEHAKRVREGMEIRRARIADEKADLRKARLAMLLNDKPEETLYQGER